MGICLSRCRGVLSRHPRGPEARMALPPPPSPYYATCNGPVCTLCLLQRTSRLRGVRCIRGAVLCQTSWDACTAGPDHSFTGLDLLGGLCRFLH